MSHRPIVVLFAEQHSNKQDFSSSVCSSAASAQLLVSSHAELLA